MSKILKNFAKGKIWKFHGGVNPPENKHQSSKTPIATLPLADDYFVPLVQHAGQAGNLCVQIGDLVKRGQILTISNNWRELPVHAPTSGKIVAIESYPIAHPSGLSAPCVHIQADGNDEWRFRDPLPFYQMQSPEELQQRIFQAGIAGLGGAVFPTAYKLHSGVKKTKLLIINAMECEPYITCDDRLMQDYASQIVQGIEILNYILRPEKTVIAIEDNKPEAKDKLEKALNHQLEPNKIELRTLPTNYPSGAAKQLIYMLTGIALPSGQRSSSIGALVVNVGTVFAIYQAIVEDKPLTQRLVTVTGHNSNHLGNLWVRLGTPIEFIAKMVGLPRDTTDGTKNSIIVGGSMMGFELPNWQAPVGKNVNCLIMPTREERPAPMPEQYCIRCSACVEVCPVNLLPQNLYWFAKSGELKKSQAYNLKDCIECGACAYVCPSNIPLVQYFRQSKADISKAERAEKLAKSAKYRFEARQARIAIETEARKARVAKIAENRRAEIKANGGEDPVVAAIARIKAKNQGGEVAENSSGANIRELRQMRSQGVIEHNLPSPPPFNLNGINQGKISQNSEGEEFSASSSVDAKKLAVARAIARAKAKQADRQLSPSNSAENFLIKENIGRNSQVEMQDHNNEN